MGEAWDAAENKPASPLDRGLYDCARDRRICLLGAVCPCVLIGRTAEFVGDEYVQLCVYTWCTCPIAATAPPGRHLARNAATCLFAWTHWRLPLQLLDLLRSLVLP